MKDWLEADKEAETIDYATSEVSNAVVSRPRKYLARVIPSSRRSSSPAFANKGDFKRHSVGTKLWLGAIIGMLRKVGVSAAAQSPSTQLQN